MAIKQNGSTERPNTIKPASRQYDKHEQHVVFGGGAIVKIAGEYRLAE